MKKLLLLVVMLCAYHISFGQNYQSTEDFAANANAFKRWGVGLNFGTSGVGLDVSTTLSPHFTLRGGFSVLPFTYNTTADISSEVDIPEVGEGNYSTEIPIKAKLGINNGSLLVDFYPKKGGSFRLVAGAYLGSSNIISLSGKSDIPVELLDYVINPVNGEVRLDLETNSVKPYFGIGFGRTIPKRRVGFACDLGAMYWGKPNITSTDPNFSIDDLLTDKESDDVAKYLRKAQFYPVLKFTLTIRLTK